MTVRYWAALRSAAGVAEDRLPAGSLADVLADARARHGARFGQVLAVCSVLVDEVPVGGREPGSVLVGADSVVDLLPPFAGG